MASLDFVFQLGSPLFCSVQRLHGLRLDLNLGADAARSFCWRARHISTSNRFSQITTFTMGLCDPLALPTRRDLFWPLLSEVLVRGGCLCHVAPRRGLVLVGKAVCYCIVHVFVPRGRGLRFASLDQFIYLLHESSLLVRRLLGLSVAAWVVRGQLFLALLLISLRGHIFSRRLLFAIKEALEGGKLIDSLVDSLLLLLVGRCLTDEVFVIGHQ